MRTHWLRALVLAGMGVLTASIAMSATAGDSSDPEFGPTSSPRFQHLGAQAVGNWKPASIASDRKVDVILKVTGAPVAVSDAAAQNQGRGGLSNSQKAALRSQIQDKQASVKTAVEKLGGQVLFAYQDAYNGVAARVALSDLAALQSIPGVVGVHVSRNYSIADAAPNNVNGVPFMNVPTAWQATGKTGTGIKIAILDTGLDYTHADFGGPGTTAAFENNDGTVIEPGSFPTAKVVAGTDFVGDAYDSESNDPAANTPNPDPDPLDCNGHGSHVAGTAAGFGVLSNGSTYTGPYNSSTISSNTFTIGPGGAPQASLLAGRIFGCEGTTEDAVIIDALDWAYQHGANVVNMSLGAPFGRDDAPDAQATDNLAAAGVVVVSSAGNEGPNAYMTGAPAAATRALSVAAIDGSLQNYPGASMALSTGKTITAQDSNGAAFTDGTSLPVKVLRNSDGSVSLGCDPAEYTAAGVSGKLVVVKRGTCARVAKAIYGQKAGAAAVAMVNTSGALPPFEGPIRSNPDTGEEYTVTIPFFGVKGCLGTSCPDGSTDSADGDDLVAADGGTVTLTNAAIPNTGYSRLASFSSGGPRNVDTAQKPEVTAPGVSVVSVGVGTGTGAATISGTSMASPMTAGVAALTVQGHPTWDVEAIKAAIINTANNLKVTGYNPRTAGSGVVDASKAVDTVAYATTATPGLDTLAYGYAPRNGAYSQTLPITLHNDSDSAIRYTMSANPASTAFGQTMTFSSDSVRVPAHGTATVDVTLSLAADKVAGLPAADAMNWFASGLPTVRGAVVATPRTDTAGVYALRVPFILAPRGTSNVTAGNRSAYTKVSSTDSTATIPVSNSGIHSGNADLYSWGISDAADTSGAEGGMDVRNVGVEVLPGEAAGLSSNDRMLVFAINVDGRASTPAANEFDIAITGGGGQPQYFVVGVDLGAVTTGDFDGRFASLIFDKNSNLIDAWVGTSPYNGSTLELPVPASEIGLSPAAATGGAQAGAFGYSVNAFSIVPGDLVDTTAAGAFRAYSPPVSTGDFVALDPGQSDTLHVSVDKSKLNGAPVKGWMVVTTDDPNGTAQADTVPIGNP